MHMLQTLDHRFQQIVLYPAKFSVTVDGKDESRLTEVLGGKLQLKAVDYTHEYTEYK